MAAMAAAGGLSKAEYLRRRYLAPGEDEAEAGPGTKKRRRRKRPKELPGGMRIVDDDVSWKSISNVQEEEEEVEDGDLPVVAEFIDERPEEVKWMEEFRASKKWKLLGDHNEELQSSDLSGPAKSNSSEAVKQKQTKPSPELSPPRRGCHNSPDPLHSVTGKSDRRTASGGSLLAPKKSQRHDSESESDSASPRASTKASSDPDLSLPRAVRCTRPPDSPSDLSPPRRNRCGSSDSDLSPPRRGQEVGRKARRSQSPPDLSPPRRARDPKGRGSDEQGAQMLSGGRAGLVSADLLRRERQEFRKQERGSRPLEDESRRAATVFRDQSGRKRDLKQERLEQQKAAQQESVRGEQYAKWGKGLAQSRQQQQNVEDAVKEMQKPLARYIDDQDLDQMLREQEREGDPMANFIKQRKSKEGKDRKEKPKYSGPAPPLNRFNIWPGYRWDGVDRSNGFEQKRFSRIASKKAVQELAYKWSVEDM